MAPLIKGIVASGKSGHLSAGTAFESIATYTGGGTSFTFGSIPSTYKHLQIRGTWNLTSSADVQMQINSTAPIQAIASYAVGSGTPQSAGGDYSASGWYLAPGNFNSTYPYYPSIFIIDILDYANTNKLKVAKSYTPVEYGANNTNSRMRQASALWNTTSAVSSIFITCGATFQSGTNIALYGIKG
jgi:hypothetical protein